MEAYYKLRNWDDHDNQQSRTDKLKSGTTTTGKTRRWILSSKLQIPLVNAKTAKIHKDPPIFFQKSERYTNKSRSTNEEIQQKWHTNLTELKDGGVED